MKLRHPWQPETSRLLFSGKVRAPQTWLACALLFPSSLSIRVHWHVHNVHLTTHVQTLKRSHFKPNGKNKTKQKTPNVVVLTRVNARQKTLQHDLRRGFHDIVSNIHDSQKSQWATNCIYSVVICVVQLKLNPFASEWGFLYGLLVFRVWVVQPVPRNQ